MIIERISVGEIEANCYLVGHEITKEAIIVDPGADAGKIKKSINKLNLNCRAIINTHGHIDHIGANNDFDLPILIGENDEDLLYQPQLNLSYHLGLPFISKKAERLLKDKEHVIFGDLDFEVINTPGHTPGGICLRIDNCLFTGDTLFAQGIGRFDFPYSSQEDLIFSIKEKLFVLDESVRIYPGHGPASTIGAEKNSLFY